MSKKSLLFLSLTIALCVIASKIAYAKASDIQIDDLSISNSLEKREGSHYINLKNCLIALNGDLKTTKNGKTFELKLKRNNKEIQIIFTLESNEIWIQNTRYFLDKKIISESSSPLIPIQLFNLLGYKIKEIENKNIQLETPKKELPFIEKAKKTSAIKLVEKIEAPIKYPVFKKENTLLLSFKDRPYDLSEKFYYKKGILMMDLTQVLEKEGYKVEKKKEGISLQNEKEKIYISATEKFLFLTRNDVKNKLTTAEKIEIKNEKNYYIPFETFLQFSQYKAQTNKKEKIIQLIGKITGIDVLTKNNTLEIRLNSPHPLESGEIEELKWNIGYEIEIPNSYTSVSTEELIISQNNIEKIQLRQAGNSCFLKIIGNEKMPYPNINEEKTGLIINFTGKITNIESEEKETEVKLKIKGTNPFYYKAFTLNNPQRYIIDIFNNESELPEIITKKTKYFSQIRTSTHFDKSKNTRIVIDLDSDLPTVETKKKENTLELIFSNKKILGSDIQKRLEPLSPKITQPRYPNQNIQREVITETVTATNHVLSGKVIIIDAGHGGKDPGAPASEDYFEKDLTLDVALQLQKHLATKGAFVILTRNNDTYRSLNARSMVSNENNADIFVSIHFNSFPKETMNGTETYYYKYRDKRLAEVLQKTLIEDLNTNSLGTKRARLFVVRNTKAPAALVEIGFLTNKDERKKILDPDYREKTALSLYKGIVEYFRTSKKKSIFDFGFEDEENEEEKPSTKKSFFGF